MCSLSVSTIFFYFLSEKRTFRVKVTTMFRMLVLKPIWIYASVSFLVGCGRSHVTSLHNIWASSLFSAIIVMISTIFVPLETWIVLRNFEWDTLFRVAKTPEMVSLVLSAANLCHVL